MAVKVDTFDVEKDICKMGPMSSINSSSLAFNNGSICLLVSLLSLCITPIVYGMKSFQGGCSVYFGL